MLAPVFVSYVYGEDAPYLTKTDVILVYIKIATDNCGFMASNPTANRQYGHNEGRRLFPALQSTILLRRPGGQKFIHQVYLDKVLEMISLSINCYISKNKSKSLTSNLKFFFYFKQISSCQEIQRGFFQFS